MKKLKKEMKGIFLFDGRNIMNRDELERVGFTYLSVGRTFNGHKSLKNRVMGALLNSFK